MFQHVSTPLKDLCQCGSTFHDISGMDEHPAGLYILMVLIFPAGALVQVALCLSLSDMPNLFGRPEAKANHGAVVPRSPPSDSLAEDSETTAWWQDNHDGKTTKHIVRLKVQKTILEMHTKPQNCWPLTTRVCPKRGRETGVALPWSAVGQILTWRTTCPVSSFRYNGIKHGGWREVLRGFWERLVLICSESLMSQDYMYQNYPLATSLSPSLSLSYSVPWCITCAWTSSLEQILKDLLPSDRPPKGSSASPVGSVGNIDILAGSLDGFKRPLIHVAETAKIYKNRIWPPAKMGFVLE